MSSSGDIVMMGYEHQREKPTEKHPSRNYEQEDELSESKQQPRVHAIPLSTPEKTSTRMHGVSHVSTPTTREARRLEAMQQYVSDESESLRAKHRGLHAAGPTTFEHKYLPFAAGFSHMADEAAVYRSSRLHNINPTAAVSDDISYYYTLDSGRVPPAAMAANPETSEEFVRNTRTATHGGMWRRLMKPIE